MSCLFVETFRRKQHNGSRHERGHPVQSPGRAIPHARPSPRPRRPLLRLRRHEDLERRQQSPPRCPPAPLPPDPPPTANPLHPQDSPPTTFPEYTTPGGTTYVYSPASFWTSGFFPGCLYLLRERQLKYPSHFPSAALSGPLAHPPALEFAGKWWTAQPKLQAGRTDTHDLGFMIQPWAQLGVALDGDAECREALVTAARSLATRFDARVGAVRSWDGCRTGVYEFADPGREFLVVIDNIMSE